MNGLTGDDTWDQSKLSYEYGQWYGEGSSWREIPLFGPVSDFTDMDRSIFNYTQIARNILVPAITKQLAQPSLFYKFIQKTRV